MTFFSFNKRYNNVTKKQRFKKTSKSTQIVKQFETVNKVNKNISFLPPSPPEPVKLQIREIRVNPKKRAILAGINYIHCDEQLRLKGCINDVVSMKTVLTNKYQYNENKITLLRDDDDDDNKWPTGENILRALHSAIEESHTLEEIWFHYSGHGSHIKDYSGDEEDGQDEVLVPCDYADKGLILDDTLFSLLEKSKCPVILTMDCCHSGTIADLTYSFHPNPEDLNNFRRVVEHNRVMQNKNIYMFSGCRDDQTSADVEYKKNNKKINEGAFTSALIEALKFHKHNVSLLQLYTSILEILKSRGFSQRTVFSSSNPTPNDYFVTN